MATRIWQLGVVKMCFFSVFRPKCPKKCISDNLKFGPKARIKCQNFFPEPTEEVGVGHDFYLGIVRTLAKLFYYNSISISTLVQYYFIVYQCFLMKSQYFLSIVFLRMVHLKKIIIIFQNQDDIDLPLFQKIVWNIFSLLPYIFSQICRANIYYDFPL